VCQTLRLSHLLGRTLVRRLHRSYFKDRWQNQQHRLPATLNHNRQIDLTSLVVIFGAITVGRAALVQF